MALTVQSNDKNGKEVSKVINPNDKWKGLITSNMLGDFSSILEGANDTAAIFKEISTLLDATAGFLDEISKLIIGASDPIVAAIKQLKKELEEVKSDLENTDIFYLSILPKEIVKFSDFFKGRSNTEGFIQTISESFYDTGDIDRPIFSDDAYVGGFIFYLPLPNPMAAAKQIEKFTKLFISGIGTPFAEAAAFAKSALKPSRVRTLVSENISNSKLQVQFNQFREADLRRTDDTSDAANDNIKNKFRWILPVDSISDFKKNSNIQIGGKESEGKVIEDSSKPFIDFRIVDSQVDEVNNKQFLIIGEPEAGTSSLFSPGGVNTIPGRDISLGEIVLSLDPRVFDPIPKVSTVLTETANKGNTYSVKVKDASKFPESGKILISGTTVGSEVIEYIGRSKFEFFLKTGQILTTSHLVDSVVLPLNPALSSQEPDWNRLRLIQNIPGLDVIFTVLDKIMKAIDVADDIVDVLVKFIEAVVKTIKKLSDLISQISQIIQDIASLFSGELGYTLALKPEIGGITTFISRIRNADKIPKERTYYDHTKGENVTESFDAPNVTGSISSHVGVVYLIGAPSFSGLLKSWNALKSIFSSDTKKLEKFQKDEEPTEPKGSIISNDEGDITPQESDFPSPVDSSNQKDSNGNFQIPLDTGNDSMVSVVFNSSNATIPRCHFHNPITPTLIEPPASEELDEIQQEIADLENEIQDTLDSSVNDVPEEEPTPDEPSSTPQQDLLDETLPDSNSTLVGADPLQEPQTPDNSTNPGDNVFGDPPAYEFSPTDNTISEKHNDLYDLTIIDSSSEQEKTLRILGTGSGNVQESGLTDLTLLSGKKEISMRFSIESIKVIDSLDTEIIIL